MDIVSQIRAEIKKLQNALRILEEQTPTRVSQPSQTSHMNGKAESGAGAKRVVSAASRRSMAAAQKARWAKIKKAG